MNVLADTSIWIDHFGSSDAELVRLLAEEVLLIHPAVIGEIACGNLARRHQVLADLQKLPSAIVADFEETLFVLESRKLSGKGIGWTDAQLVASALISGCKLWSHDKRLRVVASALGIAY